jgi:hypothetical protein
MWVLSNIIFICSAMMLMAAGYSCRIRKKTTNWRSFVLLIIILMHKIDCNVLSCSNSQCDDDKVDLLFKEKILNFQQRENDLIQKQKDIQRQLQKLYSEQIKLEAVLRDEPQKTSKVISGLEYEIPSYCANCLGDIFEPSSKTTLSSEYSRKKSGEVQSQLSDHGRLEAIKFQILLKLGLKSKPNVTSFMSKQFIFDTLQRSSESTVHDFTLLDSNEQIYAKELLPDELKNKKRNSSESTKELDEELEFDDFYGSTREIITFAERGKSHRKN